MNSRNYNFSSFLCMLALSSVLKCQIESYFQYSALAGENSLSIIFNSTISPRQGQEKFCEKLLSPHVHVNVLFPL